MSTLKLDAEAVYDAATLFTPADMDAREAILTARGENMQNGWNIQLSQQMASSKPRTTAWGASPVELRWPQLQELVVASGARIITGDQAQYAPPEDQIEMPPLEAFEEEGDYWSAMLHELAHWTQRRVTPKRQPPQHNEMLMKFLGIVPHEYVFEEAVAEIASTLLLKHFEVRSSGNNIGKGAGYVAMYLMTAKPFPPPLYVRERITTAAATATELLLSFSPALAVRATT